MRLAYSLSNVAGLELDTGRQVTPSAAGGWAVIVRIAGYPRGNAEYGPCLGVGTT